jgi:hypothetical protein
MVMKEAVGKTIWVFPDAELPPPGTSDLKGHESLIILNMNRSPVSILIKLYFPDKEPVELHTLFIEAERVRCIRMDNEHEVGFKIPTETQYAMVVEADKPVVAQYGRLDSRQSNLAFYTTMGFCI